MDFLGKIAEAVCSGDNKNISELTTIALENGLTPRNIIENGLTKGMEVIAKRFKNNDIFLPEVLLAANSMQSSMKILRNSIVTQDSASDIKIVLGTVKNDLHDIGKNIVGMFLEGNGFHVVDLGINVEPEKFVEAVREHRPQIVALSCLLTTTIPFLNSTIQAIKGSELGNQVKVIIGGAPVTQENAEDFGADGYADDAVTAVAKIRKLIS